MGESERQQLRRTGWEAVRFRTPDYLSRIALLECSQEEP